MHRQLPTENLAKQLARIVRAHRSNCLCEPKIDVKVLLQLVVAHMRFLFDQALVHFAHTPWHTRIGVQHDHPGMYVAVNDILQKVNSLGLTDFVSWSADTHSFTEVLHVLRSALQALP